jgi:hypothetical protein
LVLDAIVLLYAIFSALLGDLSDGWPRVVYRVVVLVPLLLLGLPILSTIVDLERRAGCLDLALTAPSGERYFLRRALAVGSFFVLQGSLAMIVVWWREGFQFSIAWVLLQIVSATACVVSLALFWSVRLESPSSVWIVALLSASVLGPWLFFVPIEVGAGGSRWAFPGAYESLRAIGNAGVLLLIGLLLWLHTVSRLRRPEAIV